MPWNRLATAGPTALARPAVAVGQDGNIYVFGGTLGNNTDYNTTFVFQPGTGTWSLGASMPVAREGAQAVTLPDGRIAVLGGATQCAYNNLCSNGTVFNRVDVYTPSTNSWSTLAPMQSPRYRFAAVLYHGQVYAVAGSNGTAAVASVEAYDPISDTWTTVASLPQVTEAPVAVVDGNDHIDFFGGFDGGSDPTTPNYNSFLFYDGNVWSNGPSLLQSTSDAGASVGSDGQVYVVGGFSGTWLNTVQVYNPGQNSWSFGTSLPSPTCCAGAVTVPGGQLYVIDGGVSAGSQVAIYGPSISLSPPAGPPGSTSALTGTNFAPASNVNVYWGSAGSGTLLASGTTDGNGTVTQPISFTVPVTATPGTYVLTAVDDQSQYPVTTTFVVPASGPSLPVLSATSGGYQQSVRVTGANFKPGEPVALFWDRLSAPLTVATSAASGAFNAAFSVPSTRAGTHYLIALGLKSYRWNVHSFVVRPRTILAHPIATAGTPNTLYAIGFGANQKVQVYWRSAGPGGTLLGSVTTNNQGFATLSFATPAVTAGAHRLVSGSSVTSNVLAIGSGNGGVSTLSVSP